MEWTQTDERDCVTCCVLKFGVRADPQRFNRATSLQMTRSQLQSYALDLKHRQAGGSKRQNDVQP